MNYSPPSALRLLALVVAASCCLQCSSTPELIDDDETSARGSHQVRNLILVIGDGMGPQQVGLLEQYAHLAPSSPYGGRPTTLSRMANEGSLGLARTEAAGALTVDSACSATHLATGVMGALEAVGVDEYGEVAPTVVQVARDGGRATGLISDTRLTHATPAAFAAHTTHRTRENEIAIQMLANEVDLLLSGGLRHFLPGQVNHDEELNAHYREMTGWPGPITSRRDDDRDLLKEAHDAGYEVVFTRDQLLASDAQQVLGLFSDNGMLDAIEERRTRDSPERTEPSLAEMSRAALDRLSRHDEGFFLMVEAGQIDWAGHDNDAGWLLHEMLRLDETLDVIFDFARHRDDTLVIVTADHETGGFGFSYSAADLPAPRPLPGSVFAEEDHHPRFNFGSPSVLDRLAAQTATFASIFDAFDEGEDQSPRALKELVNRHLDFSITEAAAAQVLNRHPNPYQTPGHDYLDNQTLPAVQDFSAFYVYGEEIRRNLLGRAVATDQQVVWATGAHTHTPVPVIAFGPPEVVDRFDAMTHLVEVGRIIVQLME